MYRIESLLSARLFVAPQIFGQRIYFLSNLSGRMSLYAMDAGGSVPEPLLPPNLALQNPELIGGRSYQVYPGLKTYFYLALGHPEKDHNFLVEPSPRTHLDHLACPMLVIQGKNDPRVTERESSELVEMLRSQGKQVEYLVFENEGHDVLKYENRVRCYNAITEFFRNCLVL